MIWTILFYFLIVLFVVTLTGCWLSNLFGLPGNWFMVALVLAWCIFVDSQSSWHINFWAVVVFIVLAGIGELIEFAASVLGTQKAGGSRRAATLSIVGSVAGGIVGGLVGLPVPIPFVGMIIGSLAFACVGAMVGATIGEHWQGSEMEKSLKVGGAAAAGRFVGTIGKITMGSVILVVSVFSLFF